MAIRAPRTGPTSVSVIIPMHNASGTIGAQLAALARQDYGGTFEVIASDNGSTDDSRTAALEAAGRLDLRIVDSSEARGAAPARNIAARSASGELLVFCDADDVVAPGWLSALIAAAPEFDAVTGPLDADALNPPDVRAARPPRAKQLPRHRGLPYAPSCNLAVWADTFRATDGFEQRYAPNEDLEWSLRAQRLGFTIGWAPDALVHYRYRTDTRGIGKQAFAHAKTAVLVHRDYQECGAANRRGKALRRWAWVAVRSPYLLDSKRRGLWVRRAAESAGHLAGTFRYRVGSP
ncbi:MAG TPA: glycosyltransferase [Acidimicrobiia bacterium]|nr:glycosyltransferase [Acidimicrobiia bacterium]